MGVETTGLVERMKSGDFDFNDTKVRTAYALNLCTVSVSQIVDYDDIVILEQEYEAILNNLNIERMPKDEALLKILKELLDTITFFRIQEGDKKFIDQEYQNTMKNAIWNAVPNMGILMATGDPVALTVSLVSQIGIGYMNYRKAKAQNTFSYKKELWQLERAAIEQFNGLRRELFDTAWRLVDAYDLPDAYRLTESQVKQYNAILMDADPYRKYERLDTIKQNFIAYPPFWYFFGNTANTLAQETQGPTSARYMNAAKNYYEIFVKSFQACGLLRENQIASACALEYIDLLDAAVPEEKQKIKELLQFAIDMSGNANDVLQLCAFAYLRLGQISQAATLFRRLVNEDYNTIVNAQLLSGYYVSAYMSGSEEAAEGYIYLRNHVDETYLFPMPERKQLSSGAEHALTTIKLQFMESQKDILIRKFGLVIQKFEEKYRTAFNRCIPVPENKTYTDAYFDGSNDAYAARKVDGLVLKTRKGLSNYAADLMDCDYPYNYLLVLNDMLNAVNILNCVQGHESALLNSVSGAIISRHETLKGLRSKIEDPNRFAEETYSEMLEIQFDDYVSGFFELLTAYSGTYIEQRNDIVSMNEAENNLREFCFQQHIETPEKLYETANDLREIIPVKRQYLGIELIDDGVPTAVIDDIYDEVKGKIQLYANALCKDVNQCGLIMCCDEAFDRYFIRHSFADKKDIRRKTVAILDDNSSRDNDLLFTTDGIMPVTKGKMKEAVLYDNITVNADHTVITLHQAYANDNVNMPVLVQLILTLRSKPFAEIKEKKNPVDLIAGLLKKQTKNNGANS